MYFLYNIFSEYVFMLFSFLKDNFSRYRILGLQVFSFYTLTMILHILPTFCVVVEKLAVGLLVALKIILVLSK